MTAYLIGELRKAEARVAELEAAIRFLAHAAYRDGATSLVAATALDEALALVGLPRVDGREYGEPAPSVSDDVFDHALARGAYERAIATGRQPPNPSPACGASWNAAIEACCKATSDEARKDTGPHAGERWVRANWACAAMRRLKVATPTGSTGT